MTSGKILRLIDANSGELWASCTLVVTQNAHRNRACRTLNFAILILPNYQDKFLKGKLLLPMLLDFFLNPFLENVANGQRGADALLTQISSHLYATSLV